MIAELPVRNPGIIFLPAKKHHESTRKRLQINGITPSAILIVMIDVDSSHPCNVFNHRLWSCGRSKPIRTVSIRAL